MNLKRYNISASSSVMLRVYPILAIYVGLSYILGDPARTSTPSFEVITSIQPISHWGWLFLAIGLVQSYAWLVGKMMPMIVGLCVGFGTCLGWSFGFLCSLFTVEDASLTGWALWAFVAIAQIASLQSITKDSPRLGVQ